MGGLGHSREVMDGVATSCRGNGPVKKPLGVGVWQRGMGSGEG